MQTKTKLKISDFSNIFSPKNKANRERSLTNRSPRFNYTLSPAPIRTPRAPSQNLSASSHNKLMLSELEQIDQIRKINQLAPSKDKVAMINQALQVQQASRRAYQNRMKTSKEYLRYNRNPLLQVKPSQTQAIEPLEQKEKTVTILEAISTLKDADLFQKLKQHSKTFQSNASDYLQTKTKLQFLERLKLQTNDASNFSAIVEDKSNDPGERAAFQELDDIIAIREDNFFRNKRNKEYFNIFEILYNPGSPMFQSGREQLLKLNFCFDSMSSLCQSEANQKFLRALSAFARMSIVNTYSKHIPAEFKINKKVFRSINLEKIQMESIFQIAQGQLSPEVLADFLTQDYDELRKRLEQESMENKPEVEEIIPYKNTDRHAMIKHQVENIDKTELSYLKNEKPTQAQIRQQKTSTEYLNKMKQVLKKQLNLLDHAIRDIKQQRGLQHEKQELLMSQLEAGRDPESDNQKRIRRNKVHKEQTEKIKVSYVSKNLRQIKEAERLFNASETLKNRPILSPQSKSKPKSSPRTKSPAKLKQKEQAKPKRKEQTQVKWKEQNQPKSKSHSKSKSKSHSKSKPKPGVQPQSIGHPLKKAKPLK